LRSREYSDWYESKIWSAGGIPYSPIYSIVEFPWAELPAGTTLCDVGGGIGNMAMHIAKAHPHIQVKLQDQPKQIEQATKDHWPNNYPQAIEEKRIEFKEIDFFTEAPIAGCDIYYVSLITLLL
jgi:2-polyprenyl-3-methyl-5-hydroxy-6-metoxy-1,4-benzoquinol methylase